MKYQTAPVYYPEPVSLPVRGAWVEIPKVASTIGMKNGRSPCGERGLKFRLHRWRRTHKPVAPRAGSVG